MPKKRSINVNITHDGSPKDWEDFFLEIAKSYLNTTGSVTNDNQQAITEADE